MAIPVFTSTLIVESEIDGKSLAGGVIGKATMIAPVMKAPDPELPENRETVSLDPTFTISKTPFDKYIKNFGLSALRPEIISFLDFENFYNQSGDLTGTGQVHYIQRRVSEAGVAAASEIVEKYLLNNNNVKTKLEEIASKNLLIASDIAREMSVFQQVKEDLYNATFEFTISDTPSTLSTSDISAPPSVKYEATTKFDDSTSDILGDLNSKFNNNTSIKNISKTALTLSLLRGAVAQLDGSKTDYFSYTNTENQLASTNVQNLILADYNTPYDNLRELSFIDSTGWKSVIKSSDTDLSSLAKKINDTGDYNNLFELTDSIIYEIADVVIESNTGKNISNLSIEYIGVSPSTTDSPTLSSYLTNNAKIKPVISFEDKPLLLQDINGASVQYDSLLSVLVNNASIENIQTIIDKITEVELNINDYQNKLAYALSDDIGTHFYSVLYAKISDYIKASFLGDENADVGIDLTGDANSALRFFLLALSKDELFAKTLAMVMIRNPIFTTEKPPSTISKDVDFDTFNIFNIDTETKTVRFVNKRTDETVIIGNYAINLKYEDNIAALIDTGTTGFDYFYNFTIELFNQLGISLTSIKEDLFKRIMIISIFHFRNMMQSFIQSGSIGINTWKNDSTPDVEEKEEDLNNSNIKLKNIKFSLRILKDRKNILLPVLDNFTKLSSDKDQDVTYILNSLLNWPSFDISDYKEALDRLIPPISDYYTLVIQNYAKHTEYRKESRQTFDHVLNRLSRQKIALNSILTTVQNIKSVTGSTEKTKEIISKYYTVESTFQLLDKIKRMTEVIDGTSISKELRTSNSYESLVTTVSKYKVSDKNRIVLVAVGIPYGLFEMLRISNEKLDESNYKLNLYLRKSYGLTSSNPSKTVTIRPAARIYIDYTSGTVYTDEFSIDYSKTIIFSRETGEIKELSIYDELLLDGDVKASLLQNSLGESYFEDVLGIYPRNAFKKQSYSGQLPEEVYATNAVKNLKFKQSNSDLLKSRYYTSIMHHTLFNTSKLIRDIDSSSIFDGIAYVFVDLDDLDIAPNEIIQITANLELVLD